MKRFTLSELVITIAVIAILAGIALFTIFDVRNKSIYSAVSSNTRNLQTAMDSYKTIDGKENFPTINWQEVKLGEPQSIDITYLSKNGYLKKELDKSKISSQHYWVDVFGTTWGATKPMIDNVIVTNNKGNKQLEFTIPSGYRGYIVYEVSGYDANGKVIDGVEKYYRMTEEISVKYNKENRVEFPIYNDSKVYLISLVDEYGLETAPATIFSGGFKPIVRKEGVYEFEIMGVNTMYWIDFRTDEEKPGDSEIHYRFKVKNEDGIYGEWTDDYFSLPPSKGIIVEVSMLGDTEGNRATLNNLQVIYKYEDEDVLINPRPELLHDKYESEICPKSNYNRYSSSSDGYNYIPYHFNRFEGMEDHEVSYPMLGREYLVRQVDKFFIYSNGSTYEETDSMSEVPVTDCAYVIYKVSDVEGYISDKTSRICGNGATESNYYRGEIVNGKKQYTYVYSYYLSKGKQMANIKVGSHKNGSKIVEIRYEYSVKGKDYVSTDSILNVPDESCVNVVYIVEVATGQPKIPDAPEIHICEDCVVKGEVANCLLTDSCGLKDVTCHDLGNCELPIPDEICDDTGCYPDTCSGEECLVEPPFDAPDLTDDGYILFDKMRFFANGPSGKLTTWIDWEAVDFIPEEHSKVVYTFAKSNGSYWSSETEDFLKIGTSKGIVVNSYIYVHEDFFEDIPRLILKEGYEDPYVSKVILHHEDGSITLDDLKPTVSISAKKDNNINRDIYSNYSNIEWSYFHFDPRGREITEVEWEGVKQSKYEVGTYEVKLRIKNSLGLWSDWSSLSLEILEEKPTAVITHSPNMIFIGKTIQWSYINSIDPDGDGIARIEWGGDKKNVYDKEGNYNIKLRVQDKEGNWSDWAEKSFIVLKEGFKTHRVEAEDVKKVSQYRSENAIVRVEGNSSASNGKEVLLYGQSMQYSRYSALTYNFEGSGVEVKLREPKGIDIYLNEELVDTVTSSGDYVYSLKGLSMGNHKIMIVSPSGSKSGYVDYIDVFSEEEKPRISNVYSRVVTASGSENSVNSDTFTLTLNQKIKVYFTMFRDSFTNVKIVNSKGQTVKQIMSNAALDGGSFDIHSFVWDGKDSNGNSVDSGAYKVIITSHGIKKMGFTEFSYPVFVDNSPFNYQIEGEDSKKVIYYRGSDGPVNRTDSLEGASGGKVQYMYGTGSAYGRYVNATFNINGSGFDLMIIDPNNTEIYVDGELKTTVTQKGQFIYSVRELNDGPHTVMVQAISGSYKLDVIYVYGSNDKSTVSNINSRAISGGVELSNPTNVLNVQTTTGLKTYFTLFRNSNVTVEIFDGSNKKIKTFYKNKLLEGGTIDTHYVVWNGQDDNGDVVPTGNYKMKISTIGMLGKQTSSAEYTIQAFNEKAIYRIEGEDSTKVSHQKGSDGPINRAEASEGASGGQIQYMRGTSSNYGRTAAIQFTMVGSGFDVKMRDPKNISVYIDDVFKEKLNQTGEFTYSVRELREGSHTVKFFTESGSAYIDYMDVFSGNEKPSVLNSYSNTISEDGNVFEAFKSNILSLKSNQKLQFTYQLFKDSYTTISVIDDKGNKVRTLTNETYRKGGTIDTYKVTWDGKNDSGNFVKQGNYTIKVDMLGVNKETSNSHSYSVFVRTSESFVERIEAEAGDPRVTYKRGSDGPVNQDQAFAGASNNKVRYMRGTSTSYGRTATIEFEFKGTGFDLRLLGNTTNITFTVNGVDTIITNTGKADFQVAGLPYGTYTVRMFTAGGLAYPDYIDIYN